MFAELGFYGLPGHALDPTVLGDEVRTAEAVGLGSVWLAERNNTKDIGVLSGYAAAASAQLGIASGLMANLPLRHPLVVAGYASTMSKMTNDRFALGIGRGVAQLADAAGVPRLTFDLLEDYLSVLHRLWDGEVVNHVGPAGTFTKLALGADLERRPPVVMAAEGDKTARWAGRHCDGVLLNSLWSPEATAHSVEQVRAGAREAGRDPAEVKVWSVLVTACEVSEETFLYSIIRRMNTYLQFPDFFARLCEKNGWDTAKIPVLRAALAEADSGGAGGGPLGDEGTTRDLDQLRRIAELYPQQWISGGFAVGTADECAAATKARFDAGADGVVFHGTYPGDLKSLLAVWPQYRPSPVRSAANPGR